MRGHFIFLGLLVALPASIAAPGGGVVTGRVAVFQNGKKIDPDPPAYVYLVESPPKHHKDRFGNNVRREIVHHGIQFDPHVVVVPSGATVVFPNADPYEHNAFSPTEKDSFDLKRYKQGARPEHRFLVPGEIAIFCDIHKDMWAKVKVVDSPWIAEVKNGAFTLPDVPAGTYKVVAWLHDSLEVRSEPIEVAAGATATLPVELHIQADTPKAHLRKDKSPYPPY